MAPLLLRPRAAALLAASLALLGDVLAAQSRKLSAPLPRVPGRVREQWITRDDARCVFLANPELQAQSLFSISLTRREKPVALSESVHGDIFAQGVRISPDGARVVFTSSGDLFCVATDGREEPVLLAGASVTGASILDWGHQLSPDGRYSVFWSQLGAESAELYSVSLVAADQPNLLARSRSGAVFVSDSRYSLGITPDGT